ncbi:hypothetical protein Pmani_029689 [Petrolisthes manimaculis]|uniref:Uncharacterized protein n=1 Tax=Petrolisthes manimaculis TaxID=1843537 RepID=A0AAE1TU77_9EUCA|nr:hypothetical protein Pmani_029689 [Petrolisthes manimaculis]
MRGGGEEDEKENGEMRRVGGGGSSITPDAGKIRGQGQSGCPAPHPSTNTTTTTTTTTTTPQAKGVYKVKGQLSSVSLSFKHQTTPTPSQDTQGALQSCLFPSSSVFSTTGAPRTQ